MKNLETYLRKNCEQNVIDHALRAEVAADGTVSFYLHPNGVDGETLDYRVAANTLTPKFGVAEPNAGGAVRLQAVVRAAWGRVYQAHKNPQPTYADLWNAFVAGANEARQNPKADEKQFNLAADGYCKLIHAQKAPEMFEAMSSQSPNVAGKPPPEL